MIADLTLTPNEQHAFHLALMYLTIGLATILGGLAVANFAVATWKGFRK